MNSERPVSTQRPTWAEALRVATPPHSCRKVLLVEDDFLLRSVSMNTLADLGYEAYEVPDATRAVAMLETHDDIDVLMTDLNLPDMDGKSLAVEARRIRPGIRVLYVTGYSRRMVGEGALADAATGYLSKPYQHQDLDEALRRLMP